MNFDDGYIVQETKEVEHDRKYVDDDDDMKTHLLNKGLKEYFTNNVIIENETDLCDRKKHNNRIFQNNMIFYHYQMYCS